MRNSSVAAFVSAAAILGAAASGPAVLAQRGSRERSIVVSATLANGSPAARLTPADFAVREDGLAREIIRVTDAPPPSHVMLLVDDSQAAEASVAFLRSGLTGFITRVRAGSPAPQFALMTFGERPTRRADFSPVADAVQKAAGTIFSVAGSGAYFMQAVMDACRDLRKRSAPNPVIVAFVAEAGPEFSSETRKQVAAALQDAGASLWVVVLQDARAMDLSPEALERAAVLGDVTTESGGLARVVLSNQSLEPAFDGVAALLTSRYLVTYGRPDQLIPSKTVEVTSRRPDVRLVSSRWAR